MAIKRTIKRSNAGASIVTIKEAYDSFEREKKAKGVVESTLRNYAQSLGYFKDFCSFTDYTDIAEIKRDLVINWIADMQARQVKHEAINHYLRDCKVFFNWCSADDRKYFAPFKIDMVRGQEPKKKDFAQSDLEKLLKKPESKDDAAFTEWRNWAVVNLAYDMGARAGSIVEIQMQDIDLKKNLVYLRHTKNKALATLSFSSACAKALKEYVNDWRNGAQDDEPLFCNVAGEALTYNALAHSFRTYCKNRGVQQYNLHGLRHSFATTLAQTTNGDMVRVQKALGHSSIDMARKYIDLASIDMGDYDAISPLARAKGNKGAPSRKIQRAG